MKDNPRRLIHSSAQFVAGFIPPDYFLEGVLQRGFIYSLTGRTGSGKTAVAVLLGALSALNKHLKERELEWGRILYLAGENPDDIRMRWIAMSEHIGFDVDEIEMNFIVGGGSLTQVIDRIAEEVEMLDGVALIVVDTSVAYFEGNDENSNVEAVHHAHRLRELTRLAGKPCVIVNCHPVKNATDDNLLPRGGGAFLNEMDGNLTCVKVDDNTVKLHWQGKFRGPEFDPIMFGLERVTTDLLRDSKGKLIPTVIAKPLSDSEARERQATAHSNEDMVLAAMLAKPNASIADIAEACGWRYKGGTPDKSKVQRTFKGLERKKLIEKLHDSYVLTAKGKKAAKPTDTATSD